MRYINMSRADLNLLVSFQVLMEERSVTAAANRMFLSQPAMSRVLDRLRHLFQDPLLLRTGSGYNPTRRALHIYNELEKLLPGIETVIGGEKFDPARSTDHFRIAMTDNVALYLLPKVMDRVMRMSHSISFEVSAWKEDAFQKLTTNAIDLVIWINSAPYPLKSETIYHDEFVCLVREDHPVAKRNMTVKKYLSMQHVAVSLGGLRQGRLDDALNKLGYNRDARLSVPFFGALASVVERTDLIATLPGRLAKAITRRSKSQIVRFPITLPKIAYIQVWHPRNDQDVAHKWLRDLVKQSVEERTT